MCCWWHRPYALDVWSLDLQLGEQEVLPILCSSYSGLPVLTSSHARHWAEPFKGI